jgi:hypothetical protein
MSNAPTHYAYIVVDPKEGSDRKATWLRVGAVWPHKNGRGFDVVIPEGISLSGRIGQLVKITGGSRAAGLYQTSLMMTHTSRRLSWPGVARPPTSFGRRRRGRRGWPGHARP